MNFGKKNQIIDIYSELLLSYSHTPKTPIASPGKFRQG